MTARLSTDRICWKLDPLTRDLVVPIVWLTGAAGVAQRLLVKLSMFRGEWFLDLDHGVPYLEGNGVPSSQVILGRKFDEPRTRATVRDMILSTPNVGELLQLDVEFDNVTRKLAIRFRVRCVFDDTTEDSELLALATEV